MNYTTDVTNIIGTELLLDPAFWGALLPTISYMVMFLLLIIGPKIYHKYIFGGKCWYYIKQMKKATGRNILVLAHHQAGMFGSMITCQDLIKIEKAIKKFKGMPFDFIINTLGGDVFASIKIAKLIHNYPAEVRVFVPKYAMSGGTLISLAGDKIFMNPTSSLGPVDPQLGNFLKIYSSKAWDEIIKKKGKKASDDAFAMQMIGKKVTKSIKNFIAELLKNKPIKEKDRLLKFLVEGNVEHSYQLDVEKLKSFGLPVYKIKFDYPDRIIESEKQGVLIK